MIIDKLQERSEIPRNRCLRSDDPGDDNSLHLSAVNSHPTEINGSEATSEVLNLGNAIRIHFLHSVGLNKGRIGCTITQHISLPVFPRWLSFTHATTSRQSFCPKWDKVPLGGSHA